jgi:hypothetical protein
MKKPLRQNPDLVVQETGPDTILYSAQAGVVHILNPTARHIWSLCDGTRTEADLELSLRATFKVSPEVNLSADIQKTLAQLTAKGLLTYN